MRQYNTANLRNRFGLEWWARPDSNRGSSPHPPACLPSEGDVLPTRLRAPFSWLMTFVDWFRIWNKCFPFIKSFFKEYYSESGVTCLNDQDGNCSGDERRVDRGLMFLFFLFFAVVGYAVFHLIWSRIVCSAFWETLFRKAFLGKTYVWPWGASPEIHKFSLLLLA